MADLESVPIAQDKYQSPQITGRPEIASNVAEARMDAQQMVEQGSKGPDGELETSTARSVTGGDYQPVILNEDDTLAREKRLEEKRLVREQRRLERAQPFSPWKWVKSFFVTEFSIPEEELEEYRMLSGLEPEYICKLHDYFIDECGAETAVMTKEMFNEIPFVELNPLRDRLTLCFGFEGEVQEMNFELFLQGVALFNSHGKREEKLRLCFKMHDFDNDNQISKADLMTYLNRTVGESVPDEDKVDLIDEVFRESTSDPKGQHLSFQDFSRVLAPTDFHTKLLLPF